MRLEKMRRLVSELEDKNMSLEKLQRLTSEIRWELGSLGDSLSKGLDLTSEVSDEIKIAPILLNRLIARVSEITGVEL